MAALANYYSIPPIISQCSDVSRVTKGIWLSGSGHVVPSSLQGGQRGAGDAGQGGEIASQSRGTQSGGQESDLGRACRSGPRWPRGAGGDARVGHRAGRGAGTYYLGFSLGRGILHRQGKGNAPAEATAAGGVPASTETCVSAAAHGRREAGLHHPAGRPARLVDGVPSGLGWGRHGDAKHIT